MAQDTQISGHPKHVPMEKQFHKLLFYRLFPRRCMGISGQKSTAKRVISDVLCRHPKLWVGENQSDQKGRMANG